MSASIEIPGRSSIHNSEADFVVISESPVVQLSEDADVLDGLEVKMDSFAVHSIPLKADIEKLTKENEQLKQTALRDGQAIKKHLQLCTEYKEQMTKCHERDAAMLEEARQSTLKLQDENATLKAVVQNNRSKIEDAVIREHNLKTTITKLEAEVATLREELAVSQNSAEEARMRADEASYVRIEGGSFEAESQLRAEIADLQKRLETAEQAKQTDSLVDQLQAKMEELLKELTEAQAAKEQLEEQLKLKEEKMTEEIAKLMESHVDTVVQLSASQNSPLESTTSQQNLEEIRRLSYEAGVASQNSKVEAATAKLTQANLERDLLREKLEVSMEERRKLSVESKALEGRSEEILRDNLAAFKCLQNEQASQIEALKLALRSEQSIREKAEADYANLLETWQNFERNYQAPVDVGEEIARPPSDVDRAALNLAAADRLRLEADARSLRETIRDLQAQNMRLLEEVHVNTVQQAGAAAAGAAAAPQGVRPRDTTYRVGPRADPYRGTPAAVSDSARAQSATHANQQQEERKCPICMQPFDNQVDLIQHAGICENELASMF